MMTGFHFWVNYPFNVFKLVILKDQIQYTLLIMYIYSVFYEYSTHLCVCLCVCVCVWCVCVCVCVGERESVRA